jgi:alpha-tubulin suppressor-like RCC1 family protein
MKKKYRTHKKITGIILIVAIVMSLISGFTLNRKGAEAETNPLYGKKIVDMEVTDFTGALTEDGDLYLWGKYATEMRQGFEASKPNKFLSNIKDFQLGYVSALTSNFALSKDGQLYRWREAWSYYDEDSETLQYTETLEVILNDVTEMGRLGYNAYYAVDKNRSLYSFGDTIGDLTYLGRKVDEDYDGSSAVILSDVQQIFPREFPSKYCAATTSNGDLYIWGESQVTPLKIASDVKSVQIRDKIIFIKTDGSVWIGTFGNTDNVSVEFTKVESLGKIVSTYCGSSTDAYALSEDGNVYVVDMGTGQLADTSPLLTNVEMMNCADDTYMAVTSEKDMYTWGSNYKGIVGDGTKNIREVPEIVLSDVEEVNMEGERVLAKTSNGDLYQWGSGTYGGIGVTIENSYVPTKFMSNVDSIVLNEGSYCGVRTKDNNFYMWGDSYFQEIVYLDPTVAVIYYPFCITSNTEEETSTDLSISGGTEQTNPSSGNTSSSVMNDFYAYLGYTSDSWSESFFREDSPKMLITGDGTYTIETVLQQSASDIMTILLDTSYAYDEVNSDFSIEPNTFTVGGKEYAIKVYNTGSEQDGNVYKYRITLRNPYWEFEGLGNTVIPVTAGDTLSLTFTVKGMGKQSTGKSEVLNAATAKPADTNASDSATPVPETQTSTVTSAPAVTKASADTYTKIKKPARVKIKKLKKAGKRRAKVTWSKVKCNEGYEIQYSAKKNFSKKKTTYSMTTSCYVSGKSKKKCYVRVRAVNYGNLSAYRSQRGYRKGTWSKVKSIRLK